MVSKLGSEVHGDDLLVGLEPIQVVVLGQVSLWDDELEQLPREPIRVVIFLRDSYDQIIAVLSKLRVCLVLSVAKRIQLNVFEVGIDALDLFVLNLEVEDQEETAADFNDSLGLSPRKNDQFVLDDGRTLYVKVLNVSIEDGVSQPVPLAFPRIESNITLVESRLELEFICVEVDQGKQSQSLVVLVLNKYLLGDDVLCR